MPPIPASSLFALLAAGFWGFGDFSGGMGVKTAPPSANQLGAALRVVLFSHLASFSVLLTLALVRHQPIPHGAPLAWGIAAGICGGFSLSAFYIALSRGAMGASAAISGLLAAAIPATVSLLADGSPGLHRLMGFFTAGAAIWLIAAGPVQREELSTMLLAVGAGIGFGLYFTCIKYAGSGSGPLWTMASARTGSISTCLLMLLLYKLTSPSNRTTELVILSSAKDPCILPPVAPQPPAGSKPISRRMLAWILSTALFDTSGNLLFVAATRAGRLDVASVLASLYPAGTILSAAFLLHERPTPRQLLGMATAVAAVLLITL